MSSNVERDSEAVSGGNESLLTGESPTSGRAARLGNELGNNAAEAMTRLRVHLLADENYQRRLALLSRPGSMYWLHEASRIHLNPLESNPSPEFRVLETYLVPENSWYLVPDALLPEQNISLTVQTEPLTNEFAYCLSDKIIIELGKPEAENFLRQKLTSVGLDFFREYRLQVEPLRAAHAWRFRFIWKKGAPMRRDKGTGDQLHFWFQEEMASQRPLLTVMPEFVYPGEEE